MTRLKTGLASRRSSEPAPGWAPRRAPMATGARSSAATTRSSWSGLVGAVGVGEHHQLALGGLDADPHRVALAVVAGVRTTRIRGSAAAIWSAMAEVPSVEPSSTTISSTSARLGGK